MRLSVGTTWAELYLQAGYGQDSGDPLEVQETYAALVQRQTEDSQWIVGGRAWVEIDLETVDVAARWVAERPVSWMDGNQRQLMRRNSRRFQRRGLYLKRNSVAFQGDIGTSALPQAYRAFQGNRLNVDDDWPYWPLSSLCPGGVVAEGTLWPMQIWTPRRMRRYVFYSFIPSGDPLPPETAENLGIRPAQRVARTVR